MKVVTVIVVGAIMLVGLALADHGYGGGYSGGFLPTYIPVPVGGGHDGGGGGAFSVLSLLLLLFFLFPDIFNMKPYHIFVSSSNFTYSSKVNITLRNQSEYNSAFSVGSGNNQRQCMSTIFRTISRKYNSIIPTGIVNKSFHSFMEGTFTSGKRLLLFDVNQFTEHYSSLVWVYGKERAMF